MTDLSKHEKLIADMRRSGATWNAVTEAVAKARGAPISTFSVHSYAVASGIHTPRSYTKSRVVKPKPPRIVTERTRRILARFDAGEDMQSIGTSFGITRERVRQIVKKHRTPRNVTIRARRADLIRQFAQHVDQGKTYPEIAEAMGTTVKSLTELNFYAKLDVPRMTMDERLSLLRLAAKVSNGQSIRKVAGGDANLEAKLQRFCEDEGIVSHHGRWRDLSHRESTIRELRAKGLTWAEVSRELGKIEGKPLSANVAYAFATRLGITKGRNT